MKTLNGHNVAQRLCVHCIPKLYKHGTLLQSAIALITLHVSPDPPGAPEISGYTEGEVVSIGEQKTLTCISRGGNPPAQLVWLKNGRPIAFKYRKMKRRVLAQFTFTVTQADLSTIYRCESSSKVQPEPMVALAQMNVQCECFSAAHMIIGVDLTLVSRLRLPFSGGGGGQSLHKYYK